LKAPKPALELIAAENTPGGVKCSARRRLLPGRRRKGEGLPLTFVEGVNRSAARAANTSKARRRQEGDDQFAAGASAPIVKRLGLPDRGRRRDRRPGAEVPVVPPVGSADLGTIYATLVPRKKRTAPRLDLLGECNVAFIAKPAGR